MEGPQRVSVLLIKCADKEPETQRVQMLAQVKELVDGKALIISDFPTQDHRFCTLLPPRSKFGLKNTLGI